MLPHRFRSLSHAVLLSLATLAQAFAQDGTPPSATASPAASPPNAQSGSEGAASVSGGATGSQPAAAPSINGKPIWRVGKDVKPPRVLSDPDPEYSTLARSAGYQASVVLWLVVDTDGSAKRIRVQQGAGMGLDEAAIAAVKNWRFESATRNGEPVAVMINVEVNFRLDGLKESKPLHPPPEASRKPPQFPGIDVAAYPLVVHIDGENGAAAGQGYEIVTDATLAEPAGERSFTMTCSGPKNHCSYLNKGYYPARWKSGNRELEIMGKQQSGKSWEKAEYSLKPDSASSPMTP
jgi:TonB family protein